ncbi:hypothetical protein BGY98DRAFT_942755 [Russula aff. rugulosa BPL654]|nr:hypothetical protein BGY98DRAFT_942755 [Russula aff. rugulosa BPL654]
MPRAAAHLEHRENFTDVGNGKLLCNICKADAMTIKQAVTHEGSAQHSSRAAYVLQATSAVRNPTCDILSTLRRAEEELAAERGEESESMQEFLDKLEEELQNSQGHWGSCPVEDEGWGWGSPAEDWTPAPDVWASAWGTPIAQVPQKVHHRREGSSSITSMHQEGTIPERDGAHVGDNEHDAASFVENFLQRHAVDARRRERMRIFYEMPTEQKIRKIQEVISDLHAQ